MTTLQDLRITLRNLLKAPGFALAAVASLALGIAGNAGMFSLVNAVILKPLAYRDPSRLVVVAEAIPKISHLYPTLPVTAGHVVRIEKEVKSFEKVAAVSQEVFALTGVGEPERLGCVRMTRGLFDVLGVRLQLGRGFTADEDREGGPLRVILSDSFWRRKFAADPAILGRRILLDGVPNEVVGVAAPNMPFPVDRQLHDLVAMPERTDVFLPMQFSAKAIEDSEGDFNYALIARLAPGVHIDTARAELEVLFSAISRKAQLEVHAQVRPLQETIVGNASRGLWILMGAVGLVLLIVCVNVANLALVRATVRRREMAIRAAMGASRWQLIRQSLLESALLSIAGGVVGVVATVWIVDLLTRYSPVKLPRLEEAAVDLPVLLFALLLCGLTTLLFGLLPAFRAAGVDPQDSLRAGTRGNTDGPRGGRLRSSLVTVEVSLSVVLLICAGLLLTSFARLMRVDRGYDAENIVSIIVNLPGKKYEKAETRREFFRRLREQVAAGPGVLQAGYASVLPLMEQSDVSTFWPEGTPKTVRVVELPLSKFRSASAEYFPAMGIPLRSGRFWTEDEKENVAPISRKLADRVYAGQNPIGKRFHRGSDPKAPLFTIIGVVGDVRDEDLGREPELAVYQPYWQRNALNLNLVVRTAQNPTAVSGLLRQAIWAIDPEVPVPPVTTIARLIGDSVSQRRFQALLVALFAAVALTLACVGIYSVVAYAVAQRRSEIGVRMALGATSDDVRSMVLAQGFRPVLFGLLCGVVATLAVSRVLRSLLFGVSATDPLTYVAVPLLLALTGALACYVPARRASRIPPMDALRYE